MKDTCYQLLLKLGLLKKNILISQKIALPLQNEEKITYIKSFKYY